MRGGLGSLGRSAVAESGGGAECTVVGTGSMAGVAARKRCGGDGPAIVTASVLVIQSARSAPSPSLGLSVVVLILISVHVLVWILVLIFDLSPCLVKTKRRKRVA